MHTEDIKRHPNGTIDIDFYRQQAVSTRRDEMTRFIKGTPRIVRPLIAVAALMIAAYALPARPLSGGNELRSSLGAGSLPQPGVGQPL